MNPIKYFQLKISTRIDFTDNRLIELMQKKPTIHEYSEAIQQMNISSNNSRNILEFIANYDGGFFLPEKCDAHEPIREKFEPNNLSNPISWLSQPGSGVYLKKLKPFKYEGVIENERIRPFWEDKHSPLTFKNKEPYYLGYIWLHLDEKIIKLRSEAYLFEFFNNLFENIKGEYGFIQNPEGQITLEKGKLVNLQR